jgi:hypothetical protein
LRSEAPTTLKYPVFQTYTWISGTHRRTPVQRLEQRLNDAAQLYPQSRTLTEFRAPRWFAEAERLTLSAARMVFTPHPQIAALCDRSVCLPWKMPVSQSGHVARRDLLVFIGPTLARKGAYAVREAVKRTGLALTVLGPDLEEPGFWGHLPVVRLSARDLTAKTLRSAVRTSCVTRHVGDPSHSQWR